MELYKLKTEDASVGIYARKTEDIVDLVIYYYEQTKKEGQLNNPNIANWAKKIPTNDDITKVEMGLIRYHAGMINLNPTEVDMNEDLFSERMHVTTDFEVAVSPESLFYFDLHRKQLPHLKRSELYKFQISGIFGGVYFIPKDIMEGIARYDLTPHLEKARKSRENIERTIDGHPNMGTELKLK